MENAFLTTYKLRRILNKMKCNCKAFKEMGGINPPLGAAFV